MSRRRRRRPGGPKIRTPGKKGVVFQTYLRQGDPLLAILVKSGPLEKNVAFQKYFRQGAPLFAILEKRGRFLWHPKVGGSGPPPIVKKRSKNTKNGPTWTPGHHFEHLLVQN